MPSVLTESQLTQFHADGYLIIENFVETHALKQHADTVLESMIQSIDHPDQSTQSMKHPLTVFKTTDNQKQSSDFKQVESIHDQPANQNQSTNQSTNQLPENSADDRYFLNTADSIGFFFEPGAIKKSSTGSDVEFTVPKNQSINKVGHFLHVLDPVFRDFTHNLANHSINQSVTTQSTDQSMLKTISTDLGFVDPIVLQSMLICKQPNIGGKVDKHRDSTFLRTQLLDPSTKQPSDQLGRLVGFWIPLEDADSENGCLSFVKGSHRNHGSTRWFGRIGHTATSVNNIPAAERSQQSTASLTGPDNVHCKTGFRGTDPAIDQYAPNDWVLAPVKAGSLVLIDGDVAHMSNVNESKRSRYAYTFHVIDDHGTLYPDDNWLQSAKPFPHLK